MWFAEHLSPDYSVNIAQYIDVQYRPGDLDLDLLVECCEDVGKEIESPFARLTEVDGVPMQYVDVEFDQHVDVYDLRDRPDPEAQALAWMHAEYRKPVDLINDQFIVNAFLIVADDRMFWYSRSHHIIMDGYGAQATLRRVVNRYNMRRRGLEPKDRAPASLADLVDYEEAYQASSRRETDRQHWLSRVANFPEPVTLAKRSVAAPLSFDTVVVGGELTPDLQRHLEGLAKSLNTTIAVLLASAFGAFLSRMANSDDIVLSLPVTGRATAKVKNAGGMLSNILPIRMQGIREHTVRELLAAVQVELLGALRYQRYRSEDIRRDAGIDDNAVAFGPAVNMIFFDEKIVVDGAVSEYRILTTGILEDLQIMLYQADPQSPVRVDLHGNPHLYEAAELDEHNRRFLIFLQAFMTGLDEPVGSLEIHFPDEYEAIERMESGPQLRTPVSGTLLDGFARAVHEHPERIAVIDGDRRWTYAEFDWLRRELAVELLRAGARVGETIGVEMDRGIGQLAAIYAIVTIGAAYVPVDRDWPESRRTDVLATAGVRTVIDDDYLARTGLLEAEPAVEAAPEVPAPPPATATAYVIFTSGSTGTPKGVAVSHRAVLNRLAWVQEDFPLGPDDRWLYKTPYTFDPSVVEIFWALQVGAGLVVARPDGHRDPVYLRELISAEDVTVLHFVPSMLDVFAEAALPDESVLPTGVRRLFCSGEALPTDLAEAVRRRSQAEVVNLYGPTEAAVDVTEYVVRPGDERTPIGRVVAETRAHVLDGGLHRVPVGVTGELYLSGVQLADGYTDAPTITADRFVADPFGTGDRMYRTGDLAYWTEAGDLQYVGRADFQVKIRGQRVELGEVEAVLAADAQVSAAAAIVRPVGGSPALIGYVRTGGDAVDSGLSERLLTAARRALPAHMVPAAVVVLDEFPMNSSGKLDRRALPDPADPRNTQQYRAPETPAELAVAEILQEVLSIERIGMDDNIFSLGADSLSVARVRARLRATASLDLSLASIFASRKVADIAAATTPVSGSTELLVPQERPTVIPLSYPQTRLWILNRVDPRSSSYNIPGAVRLTIEVDEAAMAAAMGDVLERHESLRTIFPADEHDNPMQVVHPASEAMSRGVFEVMDTAPADLPAAIAGVAHIGFDLVTELPVRVRVIRIVDGGQVTDRVLLVVMHHIVSDGASLGPLIGDLMAAYAARSAGTAPDWEPLPVQYVDYALWQRRELGDPDDPDSTIGRQLAFWRHELRGLPDVLSLPTDRPRPATMSGSGDYLDTWVDADTVRGLRRIAATRGITLFSVFQGVTAAALARFANTDDIVLGTAVAGRDESYLNGLVGMFVNNVVLRQQVGPGSTVAQILDEAHEVRARALSNADVPFDQVVDVLAVQRSRDHSPLFQVQIVMQHDQVLHTLDAVEGVELVDARAPEAKFDLSLALIDYGPDGPHADEVSIEFEYATDLYERSTVERFARFLHRVLRKIAAEHDDLDIPVVDFFVSTAAESAGVLEQSIGRRADFPPVPLPDLVAAQVERSPDAVALLFGDRTVTYREFWDRVSLLARELIVAGVGPDVAVAVCIDRSVELLVAVHAVVAAGGQYVPIDTGAPEERAQYMVTTAGAAVVLVAASPPPAAVAHLDGVRLLAVDSADPVNSPGAGIQAAERLTELRSQNAAYTLFTSGSTGRPKGVTVSHEAIVNRLSWGLEAFPWGPGDRVVLKTPYTFDVSIPELFGPLIGGATVVIAQPGGHADPEYLVGLLEQSRATSVHFVPSMLAVFLDVIAPERFAGLTSLRWLFASGEALPPAVVAAAHRVLPGTQIHNLFGPTEAAVEVGWADVSAAPAVVTIGRPVANTAMLVLDARLRPVPVGVPGELYLGGIQLARGYAARPELTADRFVAAPFGAPGDRMYRTGDLVRWNSGGDIEYLGRTDFQVKLRGQRIELGEIEVVLAQAPGVVHAAATVARIGSGAEHLVAYVSAGPAATLDLTAVKAHVRETLPGYMVPTVWMVLDDFVLSTAGKIDRRSLPAPELTDSEYVAPRTELEVIVADAFAEVLAVGEVSVTESFFDLGGNSLSATQVVARLGATLDRRIPVAAIFEASSVAEFAEQLGAMERTEVHRTPLRARESGDQGPLSTGQRGMWLINRADPESAVYNVAMALRLEGEIDQDVLRSAVFDVLDRHESLRTVYPLVDGEPVQVVLPTAEAIAAIEYRVAPASGDPAAAIADVTGRGFDVTAAPPVRLVVLELSATEAVVVLVLHHITADGVSTIPLATDLMTAYAARSTGRRPGWQPLPVQYLDFALWQQRLLAETGPDGTTEEQRQLDYWRDRLAGAPPELGLPLDRPRPPKPSYAGGEVTFEVGAELLRRLEAVARDNEATLFMVLQTAFAILLSRLSTQRDVVIGTPYGGRDDPALDSAVGMFVNTLALRTELRDEEKFSDLLTRVRAGDLADMDHSDIAFDTVVAALPGRMPTAYNPVYQAMFTFQNFSFPTVELPGLSIRPVSEELIAAKVDLQLTLFQNDPIDGLGRSGAAVLRGQLIYAADIFGEATVSRYAKRYLRVLEDIADDPNGLVRDISIGIAEDMASVPAGGGSAVTSLSALVAEAADAEPSALAVSAAGVDVSFAGLAAMTAAMAAAMPDPDSAMTAALIGMVPGLAAAGPEGLGEALDQLRHNSSVVLGLAIR